MLSQLCVEMEKGEEEHFASLGVAPVIVGAFAVLVYRPTAHPPTHLHPVQSAISSSVRALFHMLKSVNCPSGAEQAGSGLKHRPRKT